MLGWRVILWMGSWVLVLSSGYTVQIHVGVPVELIWSQIPYAVPFIFLFGQYSVIMSYGDDRKSYDVARTSVRLWSRIAVRARKPRS